MSEVNICKGSVSTSHVPQEGLLTSDPVEVTKPLPSPQQGRGGTEVRVGARGAGVWAREGPHLHPLREGLLRDTRPEAPGAGAR